MTRLAAGSLPRDVEDRAECLVSELVTNSVRHAGLRPSESVVLELAVSDRSFRAAVTDPGPGFSPSAASRPGPPSHWGLFLLDRMSDRWGIERADGTRVWFEIDL